MSAQTHSLLANPDKESVKAWLQEKDTECLSILWQNADEMRRQSVGDEVWLRGLIEISNHCVRTCAYCGISACATKTITIGEMTGEMQVTMILTTDMQTYLIIFLATIK